MKCNKFFRFLIVSGLFFSSVAFAIELDEAKDKGLVGELDTGYLGLVVEQADAQKLLEEINSKRRAIYISLAAKNDLTLEQVEKLAAQKAYNKTANGHYLWLDGAWKKK